MYTNELFSFFWKKYELPYVTQTIAHAQHNLSCPSPDVQKSQFPHWLRKETKEVAIKWIFTQKMVINGNRGTLLNTALSKVPSHTFIIQHKSFGQITISMAFHGFVLTSNPNNVANVPVKYHSYHQWVPANGKASDTQTVSGIISIDGCKYTSCTWVLRCSWTGGVVVMVTTCLVVEGCLCCVVVMAVTLACRQWVLELWLCCDVCFVGLLLWCLSHCETIVSVAVMWPCPWWSVPLGAALYCIRTW